MRRFLFVMAAAVCAATAQAQVTLDECQLMARNNYPLIQQYELIEKTTEYSVSNAKRGYIPQLSLTGQATYQSDVTSFPDQMKVLFGQMGAEFGSLRKDQYRAALQLDQTIWDGGDISARKRQAEADGEVSLHSVKVEMYSVRQRVNQLYFAILTIDEQSAQNKLYQQLLQTNYDNVKACVDNGTAMQSDLDEVRVEQLTARQQQSRLESSDVAYRAMLSVMVGKELPPSTTLVKPDPEMVSTAGIDRPELSLYEAQQAQLETQKRAVRSSVMPRINAYVQGSYGIPGLNIFKDMMTNSFSWYYVAGVRLQWNFGGFYTKRHNLNKIDLGIRQVQNRRETFVFNTSLQVTEGAGRIDQMRRVMADDEQIIALRTSIRKASEAKLRNGTISVSDLLRDINAENRAVLERSAHEIELLQNIYDLKYIVNEQ